MASAPWRLQLKNFRVYESLDISPEGLCVLAAPNGSGKTTFNKALALLSTLFNRDMEAALTIVSPRFLRRIQSPNNSPVEMSLSVEDVTWKLRLPVDSQGLTGYYGEELARNGSIIARAAMHQKEWFYEGKQRSIPMDEHRCCARIVWDEHRPDWLGPLHQFCTTLRVYDNYHINRLSDPWQRGGKHTFLHPTGVNLWTVLDNWKGSRAMGARYNWVIEKTRQAFPGLISDIDFVPALGVFRPDSEQALPPELLAAGLLTGLCHLTAVAGAEQGSTLTFDEVDDNLHPHAIRTVLKAMDEEAERRDLTIFVTTHSPVVLNYFRGRESSIYVIERAANRATSTSEIIALDEARSKDWLAHFDPGDLYASEDIAPQNGLSVGISSTAG